jgi:hypothetical protein
MPESVEMDAQISAMILSVLFPLASMKREMMCRRLGALRHAVEFGDVDDIQMTLGDFLMEARSLHDVIENEGDPIDGFRAWWKERKEKLKADPLLNWTHKARVGDFHHGIPSIEVTGGRSRAGLSTTQIRNPTRRT